jgi:S-formylglutathione hydrolase
MPFRVNTTIRVGGGNLLKVTHESNVLKLPANFNIFLPPAAIGNTPKKVPVIFYLCSPLLLVLMIAGLTCTPENCTEKGGFFNHLGKAGIAMVLPDTSPRIAAPAWLY